MTGLCPPSPDTYRDAAGWRDRALEAERLLSEERAARERAKADVVRARTANGATMSDLSQTREVLRLTTLRAERAEREVERLCEQVESARNVARDYLATHEAEERAIRAAVHAGSDECTVDACERVGAEVERLRAAAQEDVERESAAHGATIREKNLEIVALREQVETLTRELDEAREHEASLARILDGLREACAPFATPDDTSLREVVERIVHERDEAIAQSRIAVDSAEWERNERDSLVERVEIAEANEQTSAEVNAVLLAEIGATHVDEAIVALFRERQGRDHLRTYLDRALRGCDPRERRAIEADMASECPGAGEEVV